jgi:hypothetical protein
MPVDASLGLSSRLYWSTDGTTYSELSDLVMLGPVDDAKLEQVEVTPLVPTNRRREYRPALFSTTTFTFRQYFTKTRMTALRSYYIAGTSLYWRYVYPDHTTPTSASKYEWVGPLMAWHGDGAELTKPNHIDGEVQITGDVTFTAGS